MSVPNKYCMAHGCANAPAYRMYIDKAELFGEYHLTSHPYFYCRDHEFRALASAMVIFGAKDRALLRKITEEIERRIKRSEDEGFREPETKEIEMPYPGIQNRYDGEKCSVMGCEKKSTTALNVKMEDRKKGEDNNPYSRAEREYRYCGDHKDEPGNLALVALEKPEMRPSEALYGFIAWLQSLDEAVSFSFELNSKVAVELVDEYTIANNFMFPRPNWIDRIVQPGTRKSYWNAIRQQVVKRVRDGNARISDAIKEDLR